MSETVSSDAVPHELPITTLTSKFVISVEPNASLRTVVDHLVNGGVSLVVVDESGSAAGVVSEHDVLRAIHEGADIDEVWAADIMSTNITTADADQTIAEAARIMINNRIRHLLVMGDEGGVVSIRDVLEALVP
ncbi:MAG: CBS domain-containing protein [Acidimicrobiia bacterium]|nr:CBS domain-containing protein [Acidimicrobiia bacterium]